MMHETIKGVTEDMEELRFNTIAKLMTYYNFLVKQERVSQEEVEVYLKLLAPFAPHMTEEIWEMIGNEFSIHTSSWPQYDEELIVKDVITIPVQVNGKLRATLAVSKEEVGNERMIHERAEKEEGVIKFLEGKSVKKFIYVPGKVVNFVVA